MKHVDRTDGLELTSYLPAVAEPTALLAGRRIRFICRKTTYNGITIALAREGFSLVGLSPSGPLDRTRRASTPIIKPFVRKSAFPIPTN